MAERKGGADEHDVFAALTQSLHADIDFAGAMSAANDDLDMADAIDVAPRLDVDGVSRPYFTKDITTVAERLAVLFTEGCQAEGLDNNASEQDHDAYDQVNREITMGLWSMRDMLSQGDTVGVTSALILDIRPDTNDADVVTLPANHSLLGTFVAPTIGPMPDESHALAGDGDKLPPIGVGMVMENVMVIDERYRVETDVFADRAIIVALGTVGLKLDKYYFLDGR